MTFPSEVFMVYRRENKAVKIGFLMLQLHSHSTPLHTHHTSRETGTEGATTSSEMDWFCAGSSAGMEGLTGVNDPNAWSNASSKSRSDDLFSERRRT